MANMISFRKYLYNNLLDNTNLIYYSSANKHEKQTNYNLDVNEMYDENYFINMESWGDFQVSIYKIPKPNNIIEMFLYNEKYLTEQNIEIINEINYHINNNSIKASNFKLFCKTFGKPIIFTKENIVYDGDEFRYLHKNIWHKTPLKDSNFKDINPYKIIFNKIFNKSWNDVLQHKCAHYNGNFIIQIIEFEDFYYIIDMNSS